MADAAIEAHTAELLDGHPQAAVRIWSRIKGARSVTPAEKSSNRVTLPSPLPAIAPTSPLASTSNCCLGLTWRAFVRQARRWAQGSTRAANLRTAWLNSKGFSAIKMCDASLHSMRSNGLPVTRRSTNAS